MFKKEVTLSPHFVPGSIMGVKIKITSQKEKRIAFTIRSFYKIKLINYQYARKPITVLKSRLRSTVLFSYLVRVACHSKNGFTFKEP